MSNVETGDRLPVDPSCRIPILYLFWKAGGWLVLGILLWLLNSFRFHSPDFLSGWSWLTYGRIEPLAELALVYGFALPAAWAAALDLAARSGNTPVARPGYVFLGACLWNLGLVAAGIGILLGHAPPHEWFPLPHYTLPILFIAYLPVGASAVVTLWQRRTGTLAIPHWFLLASLLWFPWILTVAGSLLHGDPVRGVTQLPVAAWYAAGLRNIVLGGVVLALLLHHIPARLGRPLHSRPLARFAFWLWIVFGGGAAVLPGASLPSWIPSLGTVSAFFLALAALALVWNLACPALAAGLPACRRLWQDAPTRFILAGSLCLLLCVGLDVLNPLFAQWTKFTLIQPGLETLFLIGGVMAMLFGASYLHLPDLLGSGDSPARGIGIHFWITLLGTAFLVGVLLSGGLIQGFMHDDARIPFSSVQRFVLFFQRLDIPGALLLLAGALLYMRNLGDMGCRSLCCGPDGLVTRLMATMGQAKS